MRNIRFLIKMACFLSGLFYISCERTGYTVNENEISNSPAIINREVDECEDCPDEDDCCCGIESQDPLDQIVLRLCGTSDGASACLGGTVGNCTVANGGSQILYFNESSFRKLFCMGLGNAFWIENLSGFTADIYLTCQHDLTGPQILTISIPDGHKWFYSTNSSCELSACN